MAKNAFLVQKQQKKRKKKSKNFKIYLKSVRKHLKPILIENLNFENFFHLQNFQGLTSYFDKFVADKPQLQTHVPRLRTSSEIFSDMTYHFRSSNFSFIEYLVVDAQKRHFLGKNYGCFCNFGPIFFSSNEFSTLFHASFFLILKLSIISVGQLSSILPFFVIFCFKNHVFAKFFIKKIICSKKFFVSLLNLFLPCF